MATALGGALLLGGIPAAQVHNRGRYCEERIRREEWRLERDIPRHGFYSRQAHRDRQRLYEVRERCGFDGRHHEYDGWRHHR